MLSFIVWLVSLFFILVQGDLNNQPFIRLINVDVISVLIAYLLVFRGEVGAGVFAFCQGLFIDILSGSPFGLFALTYLLVFLGIRFGSRLFDLQAFRGQFMIVGSAIFLKELIFFSGFQIGSPVAGISTLSVAKIFSSSLCSGLAIPFIFYFFRMLERFMLGDMAEQPPKGASSFPKS
jgi:rod shape-determining protein MreD